MSVCSVGVKLICKDKMRPKQQVEEFAESGGKHMNFQGTDKEFVSQPNIFRSNKISSSQSQPSHALSPTSDCTIKWLAVGGT